MRIEPPAPALQTGATRASRRARGRAGEFALPDTDTDGPGEAAGATPQPAGLTGGASVLAANATSGPEPAGAAQAEVADRAAAQQGRALLGALAGLQLAALGAGGAAARQALSDLARDLPQTADPGLQEVLRAIAQRAAIELARAE